MNSVPVLSQNANCLQTLHISTKHQQHTRIRLHGLPCMNKNAQELITAIRRLICQGVIELKQVSVGRPAGSNDSPSQVLLTARLRRRTGAKQAQCRAVQAPPRTHTAHQRLIQPAHHEHTRPTNACYSQLITSTHSPPTLDTASSSRSHTAQQRLIQPAHHEHTQSTNA